MLNKIQLRDDIVIAYNETELEDLCLLLKLEYSNLSGNSQRDRVGVLIGKLERQQRLPELVQALIYERAHLKERYLPYLREMLSAEEVDSDNESSWLLDISQGSGPPIEEPPTMTWDTQVRHRDNNTDS